MEETEASGQGDGLLQNSRLHLKKISDESPSSLKGSKAVCSLFLQ